MTLVDPGGLGECDARTQGASIVALSSRPRTPQRAAQHGRATQSLILVRALSRFVTSLTMAGSVCEDGRPLRMLALGKPRFPGEAGDLDRYGASLFAARTRSLALALRALVVGPADRAPTAV